MKYQVGVGSKGHCHAHNKTLHALAVNQTRLLTIPPLRPGDSNKFGGRRGGKQGASKKGTATRVSNARLLLFSSGRTSWKTSATKGPSRPDDGPGTVLCSSRHFPSKSMRGSSLLLLRGAAATASTSAAGNSVRLASPYVPDVTRKSHIPTERCDSSTTPRLRGFSLCKIGPELTFLIRYVRVELWRDFLVALQHKADDCQVCIYFA